MSIINLVPYAGGRTTPDVGYSDISMAAFFFLPFAIGIAYVIYKSLRATQWDKGKFPSKLKRTDDNIMEAYVCLAAWMLRTDRKSSQEKIEYMANYFQSHFGKHEFKERLNFSYKNEIKLSTIVSWLKLNLKQEERSQVLYFLVGMSIIDGIIDSRERALLNSIRDMLDISLKELNSIIATYQQQRHRKRTHSSTAPKKPTKSALKLSFEILGISEHAGWDEIKKAYRQLVKKHHPDRFATQSKRQQEIAQARFIEIQNAYEMIEKLK